LRPLVERGGCQAWEILGCSSVAQAFAYRPMESLRISDRNPSISQSATHL
jgi:hypothetical protein